MTTWKPTVVVLAGLVVLGATAAARGGDRHPVPTPSLTGAVPVSAPATVPLPSVSPPRRQPDTSTSVVVDSAWLSRTARSAGLPRSALRAYARAQLVSPPACELAWTTLAGIGWVESHHGTLGGRRMRADGHASTPIFGPALDGAGELAAIPDDDGGGWQRAVGPMQFLPLTWATWARDGDGDGTADPQDLDDAAASAAAYLCADGHVLTGAGWSAAVLSYNHDAGYVRQVYTAAQAYADRTG